MKILLVNKFHYFKGGSERYYFTVADAFKSLGHDVIYFAMNDDKNIECEQRNYFVSNSSVNGGIKSKINMVLHIAYSKEAYKKMLDLCNNEKPDLVILNLVHKQLTCSVIDAIRKYSKNVPIFWTMHDLICVCPSYTMLDGKNNICEKCLDGNFKNCIRNKCIHGSYLMSLLSTYEAYQIKNNKWYDMVNAYICPSMFYYNKLSASKFASSKLVYLRNPLPIDTNYEVNAHDDSYLLYFGRLSREKGVLTLIETMRNKNYQLVVLGTGPMEKELIDYISSNNINNVKMLGFKFGEELKNYIRNSKAVVLPSEWFENAPYSGLEAMSLGKPLIVSSFGGLPELVNDGVNGYIFNNINDLSNLIDKIINLDNNSYKKMCEESSKLAKELFNPIDYINELIELAKTFY